MLSDRCSNYTSMRKYLEAGANSLVVNMAFCDTDMVREVVKNRD